MPKVESAVLQQIRNLIDYVFHKWRRTYLAGCALQGLLAGTGYSFSEAIDDAIAYADALIAELDKE